MFSVMHFICYIKNISSQENKFNLFEPTTHNLLCLWRPVGTNQRHRDHESAA